MKIMPIALACSLAFAGATALAADKDADAHKASGKSMVDKTKDTTRNVAEKTKNAIRSTGEKIGQKLPGQKGHETAATDPSRENTRAMGAARSDRADVADTSGSRQQRMDSAYDNWKSHNKTQQ